MLRQRGRPRGQLRRVALGRLGLQRGVRLGHAVLQGAHLFLKALRGAAEGVARVLAQRQRGALVLVQRGAPGVQLFGVARGGLRLAIGQRLLRALQQLRGFLAQLCGGVGQLALQRVGLGLAGFGLLGQQRLAAFGQGAGGAGQLRGQLFDQRGRLVLKAAAKARQRVAQVGGQRFVRVLLAGQRLLPVAGNVGVVGVKALVQAGQVLLHAG